jgi:hypothetical protein
MTRNIVCFKCGRPIEEGGIFYAVELKITSGFDGVINESADPEAMRQLLDKIEARGAISAEEDVFKELKINLCRKCRDILIKFFGSGELSRDDDKPDFNH